MKRREFVRMSVFAGTAVCMSYCKSLPKSTKLPNVLLIGDSISIGYLSYVQELMSSQVKVDRIPLKSDGKPENCQGTTYGVANIDRWLGDTKWDLIHFNFGLHDIKHVNLETGRNSNDANDPPQADVETYRKNLSKIIDKLKATGAKLIFATTTPYPKGTKPYRGYGDEVKYNKVATDLMKQHGIPVNDLHALVLPRMEEFQRPINVHFTEVGSKALAEQVAKSITEYLDRN